MIVLFFSTIYYFIFIFSLRNPLKNHGYNDDLVQTLLVKFVTLSIPMTQVKNLWVDNVHCRFLVAFAFTWFTNPYKIDKTCEVFQIFFSVRQKKRIEQNLQHSVSIKLLFIKLYVIGSSKSVSILIVFIFLQGPCFIRAPPMGSSIHWSSKHLYLYIYILYKCM